MTNEERASEHGRKVGHAAGTWTYDGNTTIETSARIIRMLDSGDPEIYDAFSSPDLSGTWSEESVPEVSASGGWKPTEEGCDAWEDACSAAFWHELEHGHRANI